MNNVVTRRDERSCRNSDSTRHRPRRVLEASVHVTQALVEEDRGNVSAAVATSLSCLRDSSSSSSAGNPFVAVMEI